MAAGRSPPLTGRRRRRGRGWSAPRKAPPQTQPPRSPSPSAPPLLPPGTDVEVRLDGDGYYGTWYAANVVSFASARGDGLPAEYTVSYADLQDDNGGGALEESFAPTHVRPRPPPPDPESPPPRFLPHDAVEAFHNCGWWSGIVLSASPAAVAVAFPISREVIQFSPSLVRPRRDYVGGGEWIPSRSVITVRPEGEVRVYQAGEKVEVGRVQEVYGYSWFPATVAKVIDDLSYVVEYSNLEEEGGGGAEKATEYLHWQFIRPAVEHSPQESEFWLGPGAAVEAYCDGAWSAALVRKVVGDGEFKVSINGSKARKLVTKVVEFLKPHYSWDDGKHWSIVSAKRQANSRWSSASGKRTRSNNVTFSDDEHCRDPEYSGAKKSRKELQPKVAVLAEDSEHASLSMMGTPLSAVEDSPGTQQPQKLMPLTMCKISQREKVFNFVRFTLQRKFESTKSTQQLLDSTEGTINTDEVTYQEPLVLVPLSFESDSNDIDVQGSKLDEGLTSPSSGCQKTRDADALRNKTGTQVPFVKTSHFWSEIDESDVFKEFPQQPHFLPLQQYLPGLREGKALGLMVSFDLFVKSIRKSSIADNEGSFEEAKGILAELKTNGFDVQYFETLLDKAIKVKFEYTKHLEEKSAVEAQKLGAISSLSKNDSLLCEVDQAMAELEEKLEHLRQKGQLIEKAKEDDEEKLSKLSVVESSVQKALDADKQQFQRIFAGMLQKQLT
ncbi:DUF724 domain-containing protein 3 [Setaria italica]|uniref:DUF724 domain-containing protein 3 n=1 Tax=Setaria italica TaxID=4555 RepID=UPI0006475916|nr:DUF724 domain-containing protein 3 [Setaria italica]